MSYLRKNVNVLLLLLILLVAGSLVVLTTYYQQTYQNLSSSYADTVDQVNILSRNLTLQKLQLNNTLSDLRLKSDDKAKLDSLYGNLADQNERLGSELASTTTELSVTTADLAKIRAELLLAQEEIARKTATIANMRTEIGDLESDIDDLKDERDNLKGALCTHDASYC